MKYFKFILPMLVGLFSIYQGVNYYLVSEQNEIINKSNYIVDDLQKLINVTQQINNNIVNAVDADYEESADAKRFRELMEETLIGGLERDLGKLQTQVNESRDSIARIEILDSEEGDALREEIKSILNVYSESSQEYDLMIHHIQKANQPSDELYNEMIIKMNAEQDNQNNAIDNYELVKNIYVEG